MKRVQKNDHCGECKYINTEAYKGAKKAVCYQRPCIDDRFKELKAAVEVNPGAIACELFAPQI
jgi:hypothetical protein